MPENTVWCILHRYQPRKQAWYRVEYFDLVEQRRRIAYGCDSHVGHLVASALNRTDSVSVTKTKRKGVVEDGERFIL